MSIKEWKGKGTVLLGVLGILLLGGGIPQAGALDRIQCMLDWFPNPDHVPLYVAQQKGFFKESGLDVDLIVPADPNDPLKLVAARKVQFAINYQPSVIMARAQGLPVVSIGALVQHPLSTILFLKESGFRSPSDLKGKRIGYSVAPLYEVLFEAVAEQAGLKRSDYTLFRVGFNLVPPLLSGQVDAVIGAFRNYEAIQIELEGKAVGLFPLEENGVPDFYELVLITHPQEIKSFPRRVQAFYRAVAQAIDFTLKNPEEAFESFLAVHPDLKDELNRRAFRATLPFFRGSPHQDPSRWERLQAFMLERGLIKKKIPLAEMVWMPSTSRP
jgi:putative hydroxymethylpyrimidine transport system substrate-binding protein